MSVFFVRDLYAEEFSKANSLGDEDGCILYSGLRTFIIDNKKVEFMVFDGAEVNGCWQKGDFYFDTILKKAPDAWAGENLRQSDEIFRPLKENRD